MDSRSRLRSASTAQLHVPKTKRKTIGDRAFPVAASRIWNSFAAIDYVVVIRAPFQESAEDGIVPTFLSRRASLINE